MFILLILFKKKTVKNGCKTNDLIPVLMKQNQDLVNMLLEERRIFMEERKEIKEWINSQMSQNST
jgi:hypothetical protein